MYSNTSINNYPPISLRRVAFGLLAFSALFLFLVHRFLAHYWGKEEINRWLLLSFGVMLFLMWTFWRNLSRNYRAGERRVLPSLGAGNTLTFLRGLLVAGTAGFLFLPPPEGWLAWAPAVFYTLASLGDFLDGYLARRQAHATRLGEILDMYVDGIGVFVATLLLVHYGKVPVWYLLVGLARYLFLGGIFLRQRLKLLVNDLPSSDTRRALAAVQMVFIFILLWPLFSPPSTAIAAAAFAFPFLANFLRDWLLVSGVIDPQSSLPSQSQRWLFGWLPLFLRVAVFALAIASTGGHLLDFPAQIAQYADLGFLEAQIITALLMLLQLGLAFIVLIGFTGRAASLAALVLIGLLTNYIPLSSIHSALIVFYAALFHLGTGLFSLYQPEERLIGLRAGQDNSDTLQVTQDSHLNSNSSMSEAS